MAEHGAGRRDVLVHRIGAHDLVAAQVDLHHLGAAFETGLVLGAASSTAHRKFSASARTECTLTKCVAGSTAVAPLVPFVAGKGPEAAVRHRLGEARARRIHQRGKLEKTRPSRRDRDAVEDGALRRGDADEFSVLGHVVPSPGHSISLTAAIKSASDEPRPEFGAAAGVGLYRRSKAGIPTPTMAASSDTLPVLIVGAGPVGLALAGDLGWRGRRCLVIEQSDGSIYQPRDGFRRHPHDGILPPLGPRRCGRALALSARLSAGQYLSDQPQRLRARARALPVDGGRGSAAAKPAASRALPAEHVRSHPAPVLPIPAAR